MTLRRPAKHGWKVVSILLIWEHNAIEQALERTDASQLMVRDEEGKWSGGA